MPKFNYNLLMKKFFFVLKIKNLAQNFSKKLIKKKKKLNKRSRLNSEIEERIEK